VEVRKEIQQFIRDNPDTVTAQSLQSYEEITEEILKEQEATADSYYHRMTTPISPLSDAYEYGDFLELDAISKKDKVKITIVEPVTGASTDCLTISAPSSAPDTSDTYKIIGRIDSNPNDQTEQRIVLLYTRSIPHYDIVIQVHHPYHLPNTHEEDNNALEEENILSGSRQLNKPPSNENQRSANMTSNTTEPESCYVEDEIEQTDMSEIPHNTKIQKGENKIIKKKCLETETCFEESLQEDVAHKDKTTYKILINLETRGTWRRGDFN
jgi:hypothetical protein